MEDKANAILDALRKAGKPLRPGDVASATSLPKEEVSRLLSALKKQGKVTSPKPCFYAPAE